MAEDTFLYRLAKLPVLKQTADRLYLIRENRKKMKFIYPEADLTPEYYSKIKDLGDKELEHQIGRLTNIKKIVADCADLTGDFIEFGSWKGFSLLWIAYFMERNAIFNRQLIGLDGFTGLPYADGSFTTDMFTDTSLKVCRRNVLDNDLLYPLTRRQVRIAQYLYKQKKAILAYLKNLKAKKFCFIHIDCDVSQSAEEIFAIFDEGELFAPKTYLLFDDYGCDTKLKEVIQGYFDRIKDRWEIKEHSATFLTKNFVLTERK